MDKCLCTYVQFRKRLAESVPFGVFRATLTRAFGGGRITSCDHTNAAPRWPLKRRDRLVRKAVWHWTNLNKNSIVQVRTGRGAIV